MATRENLPDALSEFLQAINEMRNTVLVPHRLVDIPEGNESPAGKCQCSISKDSSLVKPGKEVNDSGLYGTYHMLLDIEEELTTGKETSAEGCFRSHVKAVMDSMKYLTWLAKSLTQNYCEEVCSGDEGSDLGRRSFSYGAFEDLTKRNGMSSGLQMREKLGDRDRRRKSST